MRVSSRGGGSGLVTGTPLDGGSVGTTTGNGRLVSSSGGGGRFTGIAIDVSESGRGTRGGRLRRRGSAAPSAFDREELPPGLPGFVVRGFGCWTGTTVSAYGSTSRGLIPSGGNVLVSAKRSVLFDSSGNSDLVSANRSIGGLVGTGGVAEGAATPSRDGGSTSSGRMIVLHFGQRGFFPGRNPSGIRTRTRQLGQATGTLSTMAAQEQTMEANEKSDCLDHTAPFDGAKRAIFSRSLANRIRGHGPQALRTLA